MVENRRRDVRTYFTVELGVEFEAALRDLVSFLATAIPAIDSPSVPPVSEPDPVARSPAAVHLADLFAPVVLSCGRFSDAEAVADWPGAPVVRCSPSN